MMFRSEALRTRYIIRSGTLPVRLESFDSEATWLVALLDESESFDFKALSGVALIDRLESFAVAPAIAGSGEA